MTQDKIKQHCHFELLIEHTLEAVDIDTVL